MSLITNDLYKNLFKLLLFIWILSIPFKNAIYQISTISLIIFFVFHVFKTKQINVLKEFFFKSIPLSIGFFFIIFSMVLSNILNLELLNNKSWHLIYMFIIRYGLVFILLSYFFKIDFFRKKEIISFLLLSFILLSLTSLFQLLIGNDSLVNGLSGTLNSRNAFGLFLGMAFVLSLYLTKVNKTLSIFLLFIFLFFLIFSLSRSSWVATICASLIFVIFKFKNLKVRDFIYFLICVSILILLYFNIDFLQKRVDLLLEGYSSQRFEIWIHTINLILEKKIFGYGIDSWLNLPDLYLHKFPDPHNMVLEILIYTGLFGLISCFYTIFIVLKEIYINKNFILFPMATYFLVITQFDFGAFYSKELLSFLTIFVFFVYSDTFKNNDELKKR